MKRLNFTWGADEHTFRSIAVRAINGLIMEELDFSTKQPSKLVTKELSDKIYSMFSDIRGSSIWKRPIAIEIEVDLPENDVTNIRIYR